MEIRVSGSKDLVERLVRLLPVKPQIHPNHGSSSEVRIYVNVNDRVAEKWFEEHEAQQTSPFKVLKSP